MNLLFILIFSLLSLALSNMVTTRSRVATPSIPTRKPQLVSKLKFSKVKVRLNGSIIASISNNKRKDIHDQEMKINDNNNIDYDIRILRSMKGRTKPMKHTRFTLRHNYEPIRCTDYGIDRIEIYKGYFFCSNCDLYDTLTPDAKLRCNRNSVRLKCKADHQSRIFPTQKIKHHYCLKRGNNRHQRNMIKILSTNAIELVTDSEGVCTLSCIMALMNRNYSRSSM